ncbi:DNA utilization protein HofM, partial [Enterobacter hormaechei]
RCVACRDQHQWLWAMRHQWGRRYTTEAATVNELAALLALSPSDIAVFDAGREPWEAVTLCQPPLPECGADYTVALALAMSEAP